MAFFVASNEYTLAVRLNYLKRAHIVTALEFRVGEAFVFGHGSHLPVTNPWSSPGAPDLPARPARRHRIRRQERGKKSSDQGPSIASSRGCQGNRIYSIPRSGSNWSPAWAPSAQDER